MQPRQFLLIAGALASALILFFLGFVQLFIAPNGERDGIVAGAISAVFWAMASVFSSGRWNNWFNFFAALAAALSVGFLAPAEAFCRFEHRGGAPIWTGGTKVFELPCRFRRDDPSAISPVGEGMDKLLGRVNTVETEISTERSDRLGAEAAINERESQDRDAAKTDIEQQISELRRQIDVLERTIPRRTVPR